MSSINCPNCGREIPNGETQCHFCGNLLPNNYSQSSAYSQDNNIFDQNKGGDDFLGVLEDNEKTTITSQPPQMSEFNDSEEESMTVRAEGFSMEEMAKFLSDSGGAQVDDRTQVSPYPSGDQFYGVNASVGGDWQRGPVGQAHFTSPPVEQLEISSQTLTRTGLKRKTSSPLKYFLGLLILFTIGGAVGYFLFFTPEKREELAVLELETEPSGAEIWVDGKRHSEQTPTIINIKKGKTVRIQIHREGYQPIDFSWKAEKYDKRKFFLKPIEQKEQKADKAAEKGEEEGGEDYELAEAAREIARWLKTLREEKRLVFRHRYGEIKVNGERVRIGLDWAVRRLLELAEG